MRKCWETPQSQVKGKNDTKRAMLGFKLSTYHSVGMLNILFYHRKNKGNRICFSNCLILKRSGLCLQKEVFDISKALVSSKVLTSETSAM